MSWDEINPAFQRIAAEECTERQLRVLILRANGLSFREIGKELDIHWTTAAEHHNDATNKLVKRISPAA